MTHMFAFVAGLFAGMGTTLLLLHREIRRWIDGDTK